MTNSKKIFEQWVIIKKATKAGIIKNLLERKIKF